MQVTRIDAPDLPAGLLLAAQQIAAAGGRAWVVGGAVRDLLQGRTPRDFDLATDLWPERAAAALAHARMEDALLGVVRVEHQEFAATVTTLREEDDYVDRRWPQTVRFVDDPARDAHRRDFTVNALYLDPLSMELLDPFGGRADLERGVLRCVGTAERRFEEDALRLLRLVRFAASAELEIESVTAAAARATRRGLKSLSAERIYAELTDMFTGRGRGRSLRLLVELGLAEVILPECAAMDGVAQPPEYHPEGDVLTHVCLVLDHVPEAHPELAWSAVLHDVGKPPTFREADDRIRFDGHDVLSERMARDVLWRLRAPRALREAVEDVCRHHIRFASLPQMRPAKAERWMREPRFGLHLEFHRADCLASHGKLDIYEMARHRFAALPTLAEPLLFGRDVLALGVPRGPRVGDLLREVQAQIDELPTAPTREHALILLRDAAARSLQDDDDLAR